MSDFIYIAAVTSTIADTINLDVLLTCLIGPLSADEQMNERRLATADMDVNLTQDEIHHLEVVLHGITDIKA